MKKSLFIAVCLITSLAIYSSETIIQGTVANFKGSSLKIYSVSDYITNTKIELGKTIIKDNKFKINFSIKGTQQIFLKIEDKQTSLFAKEGEVYNLNISYNEEANQGKAFDKFLDLKFAFPRANEINQSIKKFNSAYQDFFSKNYQRFILKAAKKEIIAFVEEWKKKIETEKDEFVANYIKYALANLEDINSSPKGDLYDSYLKNNDIYYQNKEYMNFFTQYYKLNFEQFLLTKKGAEVLKALMLEVNLEKTLNLIQEHKKIQNLELAELYLIYGLFEVYHKKTVNQDISLTMLTKISVSGKNESNKLIARNAINSLKGFSSIGKAPEFSLNNEKGEVVSLSDFKGKYIYLGFWADWSIPSLRELKVIKNLEKKYGDKIYFVSINLDDDPGKMKAIKSQNNYEWTFLSYNNDFELKEKYRIKTVPYYFLIDENGVMVEAPAVGPTEIERTLYELVK